MKHSLNAKMIFALSAILTFCAIAALAPLQAVSGAPAKKETKTSDKDAKESSEKSTPKPVLENVVKVSTEDLVGKPQSFLGKNIKFEAKFFAFSNLALDYKPAYRSPKTHLSFLVLRPNSHIPFSELKLAMEIPKEKDPENKMLVSLKDGDDLEIIGKVFSTALDEPWVDVYTIKKLGGSKDTEEDKVAKSTTDESKESTVKDNGNKSE